MVFKPAFGIVFAVVIAMSFSIAGCKDDSEQSTAYQGVGKLVADRNRARHQAVTDRKADASSKPKSASDTYKPKAKPSELLVKEDVRLVSTVSGKTIAKATVYFDKKGTIINIKVKRD